MIGGVIEPVMMTSPADKLLAEGRERVGDMRDDIEELAGQCFRIGGACRLARRAGSGAR